MRPDPIRAVDLWVVEATAKTRWIFVEVETEAGLQGTGEASLSGREAAVVDAVTRIAPVALALPNAAPDELPTLDLCGLPEAAAFSALDQALWDVAARRRGLSVAEALGAAPASEIPVYANVNRRTLDRSPAGFAASARDALAAGHRWIKIAPFDEATADVRVRDELLAAIVPGLRRIAAVRDAIGPEARLMIDCHWRLDGAAAGRVIEAAADLGVHWVECPLPETADNIAAIRALRAAANRRDMLLAGLETAIGVAGFQPFIAAAAYDVMMPDVKYVGGLGEMMRLASAMHGAEIALSPHNPTGPVCHAVSLQVCGAIGALHSLEMQFDETPLFAKLVGADLQRTIEGRVKPPPSPGIGVGLQSDALRAGHSVHHSFARGG